MLVQFCSCQIQSTVYAQSLQRELDTKWRHHFFYIVKCHNAFQLCFNFFIIYSCLLKSIWFYLQRDRYVEIRYEYSKINEMQREPDTITANILFTNNLLYLTVLYIQKEHQILKCVSATKPKIKIFTTSNFSLCCQWSKTRNVLLNVVSEARLTVRFCSLSIKQDSQCVSLRCLWSKNFNVLLGVVSETKLTMSYSVLSVKQVIQRVSVISVKQDLQCVPLCCQWSKT